MGKKYTTLARVVARTVQVAMCRQELAFDVRVGNRKRPVHIEPFDHGPEDARRQRAEIWADGYNARVKERKAK